MGESIALQPRASRKLLHNPGTGWVMYIDHFDGDPFPEAEAFWRELEPVIPYISILYLRVSWSDMEPSPGRYAWIYDENFKALTHRALARGIRLAFRIFTDGQNASAQATPEFVREAGALGYEINPGNGVRQTFWTPVVTDPVFRRCLESFVLAFGAYYDRPVYVDYVDAGGLGWWGEMHNMDLPDPCREGGHLRLDYRPLPACLSPCAAGGAVWLRLLHGAAGRPAGPRLGDSPGQLWQPSVV